MDKLRELQLLSVDMLRQFDEVCSRHQVDYFVIFGTALGAVRHKGFIPWDDDIDIGMTRTEYRKLKEIPAEDWGDELYLTDGEGDEPYHEKVFPRVYKKGTDFESAYWVKYLKNPKRNIGIKPISLDIMLYDHVDSIEEAEQKTRKAQRLNRMFLYTKYCMNIAPEDSPARKIQTIGKRMAHRCLRMIYNPKEVLRKYYRLVDKKEGKYLISFDSWTRNDIMGSLMEEKDMFPLQTVPFDGIEVKTIRNVEKYLTQVYGDYMKLPPEDKRGAHSPAILDLGGFAIQGE